MQICFGIPSQKSVENDSLKGTVKLFHVTIEKMQGLHFAA